MTDIVLLLLCNALLCLGVRVATQWDGSDTFDSDPKRFRSLPVNGKMILWWVRWYGSYLPAFWRKPVYLCMPCMASLWSLPVFIGFAIVNGPAVFLLWPLYVLALAGLNYILAELYL